MKIAWFGAGMMGAGFVEALRRQGDDVTVWNRTFEKAKALERFGARAVEDPREAALGAQQLHIILSDDEAVDGLLERLNGAVPEGALVIDHTTVAPIPTKARFERARTAGIAFLHAPVFMGPQACRDSQGVMLCAGPQALFERAEEKLAKMTGKLWYVGERDEKASALKLFGNQMLFFVTAGLADTYALARASGISAPDAHELFAHFNPGGLIAGRGKSMAEGNYAAAFELTMARKDARLMLETASAAGVELHVLPAIAARMDALIARGYGERDMGVLAIEAVPASV
jgi:3-hydroxyisobutyrate dehydrogenase